MSEAGPLALTIVDIIRRNLEPTLEMLSDIIEECPDEVWVADDGNAPIWQQTYHTVFWLNAWARDWAKPFERPSFHTREALDMVKGAAPVLTRQRLAEYLRRARAECDAFLDDLTPESLVLEYEAFGKRWTHADRILGQIRHVQHHVGAAHAIMCEKTGKTPRWVGYNE